MAYVKTADGVQLYYETRGTGPAVLLAHELAGSCRSFDGQVDQWRSSLRCITYNARGYPPSDVPESVDSYSQDIAANDMGAVLDGTGATAHLLGVSMGAAAALQFALGHPGRVQSLILASVGSGSDNPDAFHTRIETNAAAIKARGLRAHAESMGELPSRRKLKEKNPDTFRKFVEELAGLSELGVVNTTMGVQRRRPPIYSHAEAIAKLQVPTLVLVGEDDADCLRPAEFLGRTLPQARVEKIPNTGHAMNIEEPALFNRLCLEFIQQMEAKRSKAAS